MAIWRRLGSWLSWFPWYRRQARDAELARELRDHFELEADEQRATGLSPQEAAYAAHRALGNTLMIGEDVRATWGFQWLVTLVQDIRYGLRQMRRNPAFSAVAILSLGLGIGANTTIFSLIDAVFLRSLPVAHPEQLAQFVWEKEGIGYHSNPLWEQLRDRIREGGDKEPFSAVFAWSFTQFNIANGGEAQNIYGTFVSGDYFPGLGVNPAVGRVFAFEDDKRGCAPLAVLSHSYWTRAYGADASAVGKTIALEGKKFQIIGVTQPGFTGLDVGSAPDVYVPICSDPILHVPNGLLDRRDRWWLLVDARARSGVTPAQMNAPLNVLGPDVLRATLPPDLSSQQRDSYVSRTFRVRMIPGGGFSGLQREYKDPLWTLMVAVGIVLLIACANIANLLLARSTARQREMAVRIALGAGRGRLIRQNLTESLILSFSGAAVGLFFARCGSQILISTRYFEVRLNLASDARVLLFTAAIGALTGVLFGLMPALRASGVSPNAAMKAGGRGLAEPSSRMDLGKTLVVVQVALSMVLIAGAGLMRASLQNLAKLDPGFRAEGLLLVNANLQGGNIPKGHEQLAIRNILDRLRGVAGVRSVAAAATTPLSGESWHELIKMDDATGRPGDESIVMFNATTPGYFSTIVTPLIEGRDFNDRDTEGSPNVAIISEAMAKRFFGKASAVGHVFRMQKGDDWSEPIEIVGVVRDEKYERLRDTAPLMAYGPITQFSTTQLSTAHPTYLLRAYGSPAALINAVKQEIAAVNPNIVMRFMPMTEQLAESLTKQRMLAALSTFFGILALALAALGLYGVLSYNVARRRNEIGIRMALGAPQSRVMSMILGEASWLTFIGLGLGLAGTLAATRLVTAFLYGLQADDPPTLVASAAVLAAVAAVAAYLPARRASRLDPMISLRYE